LKFENKGVELCAAFVMNRKKFRRLFMIAKFNRPRLRLSSKLVKSAKMTSIFCFTYATWVSKNAEFDAHFESVKKVAKNLMRKKLSTKK
jgi:hypothetical protein